MDSLVRFILVAVGIGTALAALLWRGLLWRWLLDKENAAHVTAIATIGLVLVTVGLIFVALLQWRTLEKTDETLKLTLSLAHRPWVGVHDIKVRNNWPSRSGDELRFDLSVELKNVGK